LSSGFVAAVSSFPFSFSSFGLLETSMASAFGFEDVVGLALDLPREYDNTAVDTLLGATVAGGLTSGG